MAIRGIRTALMLLATGAVVFAGVYAGSSYLRPSVETTRPVTGPVVQAFYSTGTISPQREYPVRAQVTGVIINMPVDKGDVVKKGQLLAVVEDPTRAQALATAQAQLTEALALADETTSPALSEFDTQLKANAEMLDLARRDHERLLKMREINAASESDIDRAADRVMSLTSQRGALDSRRASTLLAMRRQADVAKANVDAAKAEADKQRVLSPIDGVVLDRPTPYGTHVDAVMSNHLMTVADVRQEAMVMRAQVDEEDVAHVSEGQKVKMTLYAYGDHIFTGTVRKIYDKADPERRTFEVDVSIDAGDKRLNAGMTGELAFIIQEKAAALVLPAQSVQIRIRPRREGESRPTAPQATSAAEQATMAADEIREPVVWTVRENRLYAVPVRAGLRSLERVEVLQGISESDEVVTSPIDPRTKEGTTVRTRPATLLKPERHASTQQAQSN